MTDTNSTTLRNALAAAVKNHVEANGIYAREAASMANVQLSRFYQVLRGEVGKISSDALVNMLGNFGYRLTGINGSGNGTEIVLSLDKEEKVLPEIERPFEYREGNVVLKDNGIHANEVHVLGDFSSDKPADFDPDFDRVVSEDE